MTLAIERRPEESAALAPTYTEEQIKLITDTVAPNLKPIELDLFLATCARTGLDPIARQIYALKMEGPNGRLSIHVAIDGLRLIAARTGKYAGQDGPYWCGPDGQWKDVWLAKEPPAAAKVGVKRLGSPELFWGVVTWKEFARFTRDGKLMSMWQEKPSHMLAKCAEAAALRKGYPNELSQLHALEEAPFELPGGATITEEPTAPHQRTHQALKAGETQQSFAGAAIEGNPRGRFWAAFKKHFGDLPDAARYHVLNALLAPKAPITSQQGWSEAHYHRAGLAIDDHADACRGECALLVAAREAVSQAQAEGALPLEEAGRDGDPFQEETEG